MIVVLGSSNSDLIVNCTHIPLIGETVMGDYLMASGGKGANQAVAIARLNHEVHFLGCIGKDDFGRRSLASLQQEGIKTEHVVSECDAPSGIALIMVSEKGENIIAIAPGSNLCIRPEHVIACKELIQSADILLTEFAVPMDTIETAINIANLGNTKVILTPSPAIYLSQSFLKKIDIIIPNETEAFVLTGIKVDSIKKAEEAGKSLLDQGAKSAILTLGENGALVCTNESFYLIEGKKVDPIDTTGAGDSFTGSLAVALAEGKSLRDAVIFANSAASLSVTKHGAQPSLPKRAELEEFIVAKNKI